MKKFLINSNGFSVVELMVVVAIIGGLAAIGIPQYSKFQAKSRQSEAKLALAALFTAEESFRQEWNQFSVSLVNVGFSVQGARLRYYTGFQSGTACTGYATTLGAPAESVVSDYTWSDGGSVNTSTATWSVGAVINRTKPLALNLTACVATASTFTATAYGTPGATASDPGAIAGDTWTINQTKLIQNTQRFLGN